MDTSKDQAFIVVSAWEGELCKVQVFDAQDPTIPPVAISSGDAKTLNGAVRTAFEALEGFGWEGESDQAATDRITE